MTVQGTNLVAGTERASGDATIHGVDPRTGETLEPAAREATADEVDAACAAAVEASPWHETATPQDRDRLLRAVADAIEADADRIIASADRETALGTGRLEGELARTTGQLRFMGEVARDAHHLDATIDPEDDVRRINVPLGPVAVFAASNFPLAFSVAGGDTASALAAGCPVVVKAHPSHPQTSEVTARAVADGIEAAGAPPGTFSLIHGFEAGRRLVTDPRIRAVGFTGSFRGGTAIVELASTREDPIPVHAEMGSVNPVVLTAAALNERGEEIADGYVGSLRLGVGQFCTNPGLVFVPAEGFEELRSAVAARVVDEAPAPMLNQGIRETWAETTRRWADRDDVEIVVDGTQRTGDLTGCATVLAMTASQWRRAPELHEECFGPTSVLVRYEDDADLFDALAELPGSLTGSVHASAAEHDRTRRILDALRPKVGRLISDGWPTGVAVDWAMHHGGPFPATTDPRHTSVGAGAVRRFMRPVCYQGLADPLLPPGLRDDDPWGIPRRVGGQMELPEG